MAYDIQILPRFQNDLNAAVDYIAGKLSNKKAAYELADSFYHAAIQVADYPLASPHYSVVDGTIYRAVRVKNYLAFYVVIDTTVEFRRFLYARSDLTTRLTQ